MSKRSKGPQRIAQTHTRATALTPTNVFERRLGVATFLVPLLLTALATLATIPKHGVVGALSVSPVAFVVMLIISVYARIWPRRIARTLRADERGLSLDQQIYGREQILSASILPMPNPPLVRISLRGARPLELEMPTSESAHSLLEVLGEEVTSHQSNDFLAFSFLRVIPIFFATLLFGIVAVWINPVLALLAAPLFLVLSIVFVLFLPTRISVGTDGVLVREIFGKSFIPFGAIAAVRKGEGRRVLVIELTSGTQVTIPMSNVMSIPVVVERLEEALHIYRSRATSKHLDALDRGGLSVPEWLKALRATGAGANATLRTAYVDIERLLGVLESPTSRPVDRVAAAVAIQSSDDVDAKMRVRVAATSVGSPRLRVALAAVADADDTNLEVALEAFDANRHR